MLQQLAKASLENIDKIAVAFQAAGMEFYNGDEPGVRIRKRDIGGDPE